MSARMQTQAKALPKASFTPVMSGLLQRKCACGGRAGLDGMCEQCRSKRLQRRSANGVEPATVPPIVHEVLRSPGQPLDPQTRAFFEPHFGHDFSKVRVHASVPQVAATSLTIGPAEDHHEREANRVANRVMGKSEPNATPNPETQDGYDFSQVRVHMDARAAESSRAVNALAYTVGRDIVFGAGQYAPGTSQGKHLLAHELTHMVQQAGPFQHALTMQRTPQQRTTATLSTEGNCIDARAIAEAIPGAKAMAMTAFNWFLSFNPRDQARIDLLLRANFLSDSEDARALVKDRLLRIRELLETAQSGRLTFVCEPTTDPECGGRQGYVLNRERGRIHLCDGFFNLTLEGRRWMLVHECAHLAGAMLSPEQYWGFFGPVSESNCRQSMSLSSTREALGNADNYARLVWCLTRQSGIEVTPP